MNGGTVLKCELQLFCVLCMVAIIRISLLESANATVPVRCIASERLALLSIKKSLVDPTNLLSSWTSEEEDCCRWNRVGCNNQTGHVVMLDLRPVIINRGDSFSTVELTGPQFPTWLQSQRNFSYLDISNSSISDAVPSWFWNFPSKLRYLNLSFNHIYGKLPNPSVQFYTFPAVDLSSNLFYGPIPRFLSNTTVLNLSKNTFTGSLSVICTVADSALSYLDLSDNLLSGSLPDCWKQMKMLTIMNLENNNFSGIIPSSMGFLHRIQTLRLRNNNFTGELPSTLKNCSLLELLDLGENKLVGNVSAWIGESLRKLIVLRLQSNDFFGVIPSTICHLSSLQILDISFNNLSGPIPSCLKNLTAMAQNRSFLHVVSDEYTYSYSYWNGSDEWSTEYIAEYFDYISVIWRGIEQEYGRTLGLLKLIDLSNNNLTGRIPKQVMSLFGIISLNLSRNSLIGEIPKQIGQLKALESLDLSHNQLSGEIPESVAYISFLAVLNLSNNQLKGRIPTGTQLQGFNASVYSNNLGLCGPPLPKCQGERTMQDPSKGNNIEEGEEWFERSWLYAGAGMGFFVGLWGLYVSLIINKSWRYSYFQFLNYVVEWFYFR
ncbi:hypothetical protein JCGZ_17544 [Jatropha curcas]|uniref:Leucine-rich repeat-containing N-terminal plant-type domain-containing protein n=1 Tax=Jatropha curcas TaxID=180498 RepID=A0A067JQZ9_JATCU|nr:hypothetical protein JCGZ_17544 [Jatropha curcas]